MLYETVRYLAQTQNKTVTDVEKEAGLSRGAIGKWKISDPKLENAKKVADVLGVSVDFLVDRS